MNSNSATNKPFSIEKRRVYEAYKAVKSNRGAAGVDGQTLEMFETDLAGNLYKIWNRMSSGTYFPPPVRAVSIPKKTDGERILGVPTISDRIAQTVVKQMIEPELEPIFLPDSYGYRPGKSALDAVGVTRQRCWKYDWVLEFDIKGLFDNLPHDLLLKAVRRHVQCKWALLYIERWLTASMEKDGKLVERMRGTPQGGVISPILANLFLHYTFDLWMARTHPDLPWCRMLPTDWCTAGPSKKQKPLAQSFKRGWKCADFRCTRQRRRSFIARITGVGERIRRSSLTFSDISSGRGGWQRHRGGNSSADTPRRSVRQL